MKKFSKICFFTISSLVAISAFVFCCKEEARINLLRNVATVWVLVFIAISRLAYIAGIA